jgi:TonB family protein
VLWLLLTIAATTATQQPSRATPIDNPGSWISNADYPAEALRRRAHGPVGFRLTIDASGVPTACAVTASSQDRSLDEATCTLLLARARFRPARDAQGNAVTDSFVSRIRWTIDEPIFLIGLTPIRIVNSLSAQPGGLVVCNLSSSDARPSRDVSYLCAIGYSHDQIRRFATRFGRRSVILSDSAGYAPEPGPDPPPEAEYLGQHYARSELRLVIAPNGNVAQCSTVRRTREAAVVAPEPPDACDYYRRNHQPIFASSPGPQPRSIRVTHDYYIRLLDLEAGPKG